jgi:hypothetical protein
VKILDTIPPKFAPEMDTKDLAASAVTVMAVFLSRQVEHRTPRWICEGAKQACGLW